MLASASSTLPVKCSSRRRRRNLRTSCVSGRFSQRGALALDEVGHGVHAEAVHAHLEPELHDVPDLLAHRRVVVVEVRLVAEEAVPVVRLARPESQAQFERSVSQKMMRTPRYWSSVSLHTYQSRRGLSRELRASWNQGCWSDVWLSTSSVMTRRPRACAASRKRCESRRACRSRDGCRSSPRCRSRRRGTARGTSAGARGSRRRGPGGGRACVGQAAEVADAVAVAVAEGLDVQLVEDGVLVPVGVLRWSPAVHVPALPWPPQARSTSSAAPAGARLVRNTAPRGGSVSSNECPLPRAASGAASSAP